MPTYHRSQRLRLVGTGPKVEQLQEGRFRLTFTCSSTNPSEAWMQGNKSQIFAAYGTLESAEMSIAGIAPRTSEAYSDMVLFRTEANPSERDLIVTLIYETATTSFVKSQDDKIDFELNGLQRVTRVTIAKTGTSLPSVTIGTTSITVNGTACKLASRSVEENDAFIQITETYIQQGILSVSQDFTLDVNQITVQSFNQTEAEVKTALSEVTSDHKLIRQSEQNHDGMTATSYVFEVNTSDIINFTADDRLQVTRTIYEVYNYDYDGNYTVNTSTATVNSTSVTLTSLRVDQRGTSGTFTKLTAVYTQPKIISASPVARNQYNLTPLYQYRSLSATPKTIDTAAALATPNGGTIGANAVFLEPDVSNTSSPPVITQNVLDTSVDLSVSDSSALISSNQDLYNFLYPGVVRLDSRFFGPFLNSSSDSTLRFNRIDISTNKEAQPVTTKIRCQVYNFIQRSDQIVDTDFTYDGASGLWSPNSWATVDAKIIKNYFGTAQEPSQLNNVYTGYRINGSSIRGNLTLLQDGLASYNAVVVYNGVNYGYSGYGYFYEIKITEPGPPDPIGKKWCLGVDIQPAFRDSNNNTYYNKQIIVTEVIPSLQRGQITYT